jgi:putative hydrolase of the HAD superfamily
MQTTECFPDGQTLLLDADDTLWENNVYFERAIASFISYLDHSTFTHEEIRATLNVVERETISLHGYGLRSFRRSLVTCFERLSTGPVTPEKHDRIVSFANAISEQEIELLPHVADTLPKLASRHRLILVTKGHPVEQMDKLTRSGIESWFHATEVLAEKHPTAYGNLLDKYALDPGSTWMIGNSPKSDINPALEAGVHAVFIPHDHTWVLEHETLNPAPAGQRLLELENFGRLANIF